MLFLCTFCDKGSENNAENMFHNIIFELRYLLLNNKVNVFTEYFFIFICIFAACMIERKELIVEGLGAVIVSRNPRARRYSLRIENGHVLATMPVRGSERELLSFIDEKRDHLIQLLENAPRRPQLDENAEFKSQTFSLRIACTDLENIYVTLKEGVLLISCPMKTDFSDENVQKVLWSIIENALRHEAKRILHVRTKELAGKHGFKFAKVKINNSRTHWGSCTGQKNINLSLSVMLLPEHLSDYILLHELCHTIEMNHSERFWSLMDKVTEGKFLQYRKELRKYRMLNN
jgi:Predicted metal-dependent hydrolase